MAALLAEDRGDIRILTIDNQPKRNALDPGLLSALEAAVAQAGRERVRCVIFRGAGDKAFSSGFDLSALPVEALQARGLPDDLVERAMAAIESLACPTIALLNGSAFGAGCELAATCDLRVAGRGVSMGMPPAKLGLIYSAAGLSRFAHLMGWSAARELFFTGQPLDASSAAAAGLIDHLVEDPEAKVLELARAIAENAPLAVQGMKRIFRVLAAPKLSGVELDEIQRARRQAFESEDAREGRTAFMEKRPPKFNGA